MLFLTLTAATGPLLVPCSFSSLLYTQHPLIFPNYEKAANPDPNKTPNPDSLPLKLQHQCRNTNLSLPLILMGMEEQRALQDCIKAEHAVAVNLASGSMMHSDREQSAVGRMAGSRGDMGNVRAWGTWEMGEHGECRT